MFALQRKGLLTVTELHKLINLFLYELYTIQLLFFNLVLNLKIKIFVLIYFLILQWKVVIII